MFMGFTELREILMKWPIDISGQAESADGNLRRIMKILRNPDAMVKYKKDFQVLIRNVLGTQKARDGIASLTVYASNGWPTADEWAEVGVATSAISNRYRLEVEPWSPEWLCDNTKDILHDIYRADNCRHLNPVSGDPAMRRATGFETYSSHGQRNAVRSLLFAPLGSTLLVNLPTGSGKSLVGYMPSLLNAGEGNMTLFIVPTVALAIDQARQFQEIFQQSGRTLPPIPLCWHGGLSKDERSTIKDNIRSGQQLILFCSPESVCTSLKPALYIAAANRYLRYCIIDEAHIISQWGDAFRPAFQAVAGVRLGLFRECGDRPFTTVLMTATLTDDTLRSLEPLFNSPRGFQIVSAVHLRPEPRYWIAKAQNRDEKTRFVLEVLHYVPRPLILYVTERDDAEKWFATIRQNGFCRVACFHGNTPAADRERIISQWRNEELDIVVATSAFGLGIDKSDVRTVIHACVPETLDRFYQEVGRGGRDGKPSLSLLIYTEYDFGIAKGMNKPKIISDELGKNRWSMLMNNKKNIIDDLISLNIETVPAHLKQQSDENKNWNLRTILLLARAQVLQLDDVRPESTNHIELNQSLTENDTFFNQVIIRILNPSHQNNSVWEGPIANARNQSIESSSNNFRLLKQVLTGVTSMEEALFELYRIDRLHIIPTKNCGGCPSCRQNSTQQDFIEPISLPIRKLREIDLSAWNSCFPQAKLNPLYISYVQEKLLWPQHFAVLTKFLINQFGVREFLFLNKRILKEYHAIMANKFLAQGIYPLTGLIGEVEFADVGMPLPCLSLLYPWNNKALPDHLLINMVERPLHIIMFPECVEDRFTMGRRYVDVATNHIRFDDLLSRVKQWEY